MDYSLLLVTAVSDFWILLPTKFSDIIINYSIIR